VAQVVQADRWQAGLGGQLQEPVGHLGGMELLAVEFGEDYVGVDSPSGCEVSEVIRIGSGDP
jgi:hypothetical protein